MNDSALNRFFGVVARPRTWLGIVFHILAFPLGLFYFVFLVTGLSVGVGLVVIWIGIPILLVVAGAWWLFAAFERVQARYLLGAELPPAPRPWERVDGIWGKLKAHFGSGSTWRDLAYLFVKFPMGLVSFLLLVAVVSAVGSVFAMPVFALFDEPMVNGTWVPPLWLGLVCIPVGILALVLALHLMNAWGWVCARWAEIVFRSPATSVPWAPSGQVASLAPSGQVAPPAPSGPLPPPEPLVRQAGATASPAVPDRTQTAAVLPAATPEPQRTDATVPPAVPSAAAPLAPPAPTPAETHDETAG